MCRFLRNSHGINVSCVDVSIFQTESHEVVVSTETIVGDEDFAAPKTQQHERPASPPRPPSDHPAHQVVWEAIQEFTKGDLNATFTLKDIEQVVSEKHPDFNKNRVRDWIRRSCVNFPSQLSNRKGEDRYWWVERGVYRLYDPKNDKVEKADE